MSEPLNVELRRLLEAIPASYERVFNCVDPEHQRAKWLQEAPPNIDATLLGCPDCDVEAVLAEHDLVQFCLKHATALRILAPGEAVYAHVDGRAAGLLGLVEVTER